jgi:hypothetical protein
MTGIHDDEHGDYEVGYGKPPRHSRFKPGQSGNPRGRAKGSRGLKADLHAELVSRMEIQMNGKKISGTKQQLMLKTLTARAASGDVRAIKALIDLVMQIFGPEDRGGEAKRLSAQDQQILDEMLRDRGIGDGLSATAQPIGLEGKEGSDH